MRISPWVVSPPARRLRCTPVREVQLLETSGAEAPELFSVLELGAFTLQEALQRRELGAAEKTAAARQARARGGGERPEACETRPEPA